MRHLDEGRIQEWLDHERSGMDAAEVREVEEHLATCERCAELAARLETMSTSAMSLLGDVQRSSEQVPEFSEVVARAEQLRSVSEPSRARRRWVAPAWAASVVLAVGAGWLVNEASRTGRSLTGTAPTTLERGIVAPAGERATADDDGAAVGRATVDEAEMDADPTAGLAEEAVATGSSDAATPSPAAGAPDVASPPPATTASRLAPGTAPAGSAVAELDPDLQADVLADRSVAGRGGEIRGRVSDENGAPLSDVQVFIPGEGIGALTDAEGAFALSLGDDDDLATGEELQLTAQLIGYRSETTRVTGAADEVLDIRLAQQALTLDQVVVTGAGNEARRTSIVGAAGRQLEVAPVAPVERAESAGLSPEAGADASLASKTEEPAWRAVSRAEAEAWVGFALVLPAEGVLEHVDVAAIDDSPVARAAVRLDDGSTLTLLEARGAISVGAESRPPDHVVVSTTHEGLTVLAIGPQSEARVRALLRMLR